ncbi:hypothetical protein FQR65_LT15989 [Abscondita terminalis]|nr:hypothetical protein FQR65_LT15989 [Abscondita terminalis]
MTNKSVKSKKTDIAKHSLNGAITKNDRASIITDRKPSEDTTTFEYIFKEYWNKFCTNPCPTIVAQSTIQTKNLPKSTSLSNTQSNNSLRTAGEQPELIITYNYYEQQTKLNTLIFKNLIANKNTVIALRKSLNNFETLKILKLEFCNLQNTDLRILKNVLIQNESIQTLSISGNPNLFQNFYILIKNTRLSQICLRLCHINDRGVELISRQLKTIQHPLVFLDLSSNFISDDGVVPICEALRLNRSLLSLNLADNWITEVGCIAIVRVLQKFPLMYDEFLMRRRRIFELYKERAAEVETQKTFPSTVSVISRKSSQSTKRSKSKPSISSKSNSIHSKRSYDRIIPEIIEYVIKNDRHPFVKDCFIENDQVVCIGNLTLFNLNLAYNKISSVAYQDILDMLLYQEQLGKRNVGLNSFIVEGNPVENDCKDINYLSCLQQHLRDLQFSNISLYSKSSLRKKRSTISRIHSANV